MSTYIHYTEEEKERARQTDIVDLLRRQGEDVKRSGSEFVWTNGTEKITIRGNLWYHHYDRVGGNAIDFVRRFYDKSYPEAMEYLLGEDVGRLTSSPVTVVKKQPPTPPPQNDNMRRVYAYLLKQRGIDRDVLNHFAHTKPYTVADKGARRVSYTSRQIVEDGIRGFATAPRKEAQKKAPPDDDAMSEQNDPTPHGTVRTPQESE